MSPADGFRVIYDREVPFELRVQESADGPQQVGTLEAIKVKVLLLVRSRTQDSMLVVRVVDMFVFGSTARLRVAMGRNNFDVTLRDP